MWSRTLQNFTSMVLVSLFLTTVSNAGFSYAQPAAEPARVDLNSLKQAVDEQWKQRGLRAQEADTEVKQAVATRRQLAKSDESTHVAPERLPGDHVSCTHSEHPASHVLSWNVTDGVRLRCFQALLPLDTPTENYPLPVFIYFHGTKGNAEDCGQATDDAGNTWISVAHNYGFILVCVESTMFNMSVTGVGYVAGGVWDVPEIQNSSTGTRCEEDDSVDIPYIKAVMGEMEQCDSIFDLNNIFTHGCSGGSSAAFYMTTCMHKFWPDRVNGFATHSTGLKIKGDGIWLGSALYGTWAECDLCEFFPAMVEYTPDLKVCVYDNYDDPTEGDPYYYETSKQLAEKWNEIGNPVEESYGYGGHCATHSRPAIAECIDDGQGRLITRDLGLLNEVTTTTTIGCSNIPPDENYADADTKCQEYELGGKCGYAYMSGWCCNTCHDCDPDCETYFDGPGATAAAVDESGDAETCTNIPPGDYTDPDEKCQDYADEGKCGNTWMNGWCCSTCHNCEPDCETYFDTTTAGPTTERGTTYEPPVCYVLDTDSSSDSSGSSSDSSSASSSDSSGASSSGSGGGSDNNIDNNFEDEAESFSSNVNVDDYVVSCEGSDPSIMCQWWPYLLIGLALASIVAMICVIVLYKVRSNSRQLNLQRPARAATVPSSRRYSP